MDKSKIKMITYGAICIAIAQILSYIKVYELPQAGSVTLGSMVPILLFAILFGAKDGILIGVVYGIFQLILGGKFFHIGSMLLDYIFAFGALGIAGFFRGKKSASILGALAGIFGRFFFHFLSGFLIFASYAPEGQNPIIYSFFYNLTYIIPDGIFAIMVLNMVYIPVRKYLKQGYSVH